MRAPRLTPSPFTLVVRTEEALESFKKMKVTLGAELGVAAGPYGAGAAAEMGLDRSPVLSYSEFRNSPCNDVILTSHSLRSQVYVERSSGPLMPRFAYDRVDQLTYAPSLASTARGMYAGVEAVAQVFITRTEENETVYFWPGVTQREIVSLPTLSLLPLIAFG